MQLDLAQARQSSSEGQRAIRINADLEFNSTKVKRMLEDKETELIITRDDNAKLRKDVERLTSMFHETLRITTKERIEMEMRMESFRKSVNEEQLKSAELALMNFKNDNLQAEIQSLKKTNVRQEEDYKQNVDKLTNQNEAHLSQLKAQEMQIQLRQQGLKTQSADQDTQVIQSLGTLNDIETPPWKY